MWTAVILQPGGDKPENKGQYAMLLLRVADQEDQRADTPGGTFELLHRLCPANLWTSCCVRQTHLGTMVGFSTTAAERILQGYPNDAQDHD